VNKTGPKMARGWAFPGLRLVLAGLMLALAGEAMGEPGPEPNSPSAVWRVVLIRSWDSLYPMNVAREKALREALAEGASRTIDFYPEEIDPLRFPGAIESDIVGLLQRKYGDTPIDLVIASGIESLGFAERNRDAIWPGAAIVFNGVFDGASWHRPPRSTGVTMPLDIDGTVAAGRALIPGLSRLYVVSGASEFDRGLLAIAMRKLERQPLEVKYLVGLTRAQASARVSTLESDEAVLYLTMLRDGDNQLSGPTSPALVHITASASVPVLSPIQTQYGRGVLGGSAARFDAHGRAAGEVARKVLEGADPDAIDVKALPQPACEIDWLALRRWHIAEANVPSSCTMLNQPPDPLQAYLWQIVVAVAIIVFQAALLFALLIQSRRRHLAEARLRARTHDLAQESRVSMIGALTASLAHEINQPMGAILSNTEAAQMMLEQGTLTPEKLREILDDIRSDDLRASEVIRTLRALFSRSHWRPTAIETNTEVAEALRHVEFEAQRRNVTLSSHFASNMPAVLGDPVQVQQVVINLVVNAIEAVAQLAGFRREVRIETRACPDGVGIDVADEGPGVSAEEAGQLFDPAFTNRRNGMGFGLSIVRSIVEMHHGRVWFEPNVPRGSVFRVWLPAIGR
jgi:signal transduction histidine kinase